MHLFPLWFSLKRNTPFCYVRTKQHERYAACHTEGNAWPQQGAFSDRRRFLSVKLKANQLLLFNGTVLSNQSQSLVSDDFSRAEESAEVSQTSTAAV